MSLTIREELRKNLIFRLEQGTPLFPQMTGYEHTVIPKLENALLAGHDIILLGERGQGKTRLIRSLAGLLDEEIPIIRGSEVSDNPFAPISRYGIEMVADLQDKTELEWLPRSRRYTEKLATSDTTSAELIGEIDPIKVAEGRYLSDELTIHFGLIPRANRGIFAINELPDLSEKVQVGLFNILEERDIQIKGYKMQLPLDILVVATANPEDYTSRGRIITPLKDRYAAHITTHYPMTREVEMAIVSREAAHHQRGERTLVIPQFLAEVISEITFQARRSPDISQVSGVSVRMTISNMESLISNAEKRAILQKQPVIIPRITDLEAVLASSEGKLELEYAGQNKSVAQVVRGLIDQAVLTVFNEYWDVEDFEALVGCFQNGWWVEVSDQVPDNHYQVLLPKLKGLESCLLKLDLGPSNEMVPAAVEFVLEGLALHEKLNKDRVDDKVIFNETRQIQPMGRNPEMA